MPIYTLNDCYITAKNKNGLCLSKEYINNKIKMKWLCNLCNYIWKSNYSNIVNHNSWCPKCSGNARLSLKDCQKTAETKNGKCLSTKYKNKDTTMEWQCNKCTHIWKTKYGSIRNKDSWCPNCVGVLKYTLEQCQQSAIKRNGKCLSKEYINIYQHMEWQCGECSGIWKACYSSIKNMNSWCPFCFLKNEQECRTIIEKIYHPHKFPKKRPSFLKTPEHSNGLELDGYNQKLRLAFEYDGRQHFRPNYHWGGDESLKKQKEKR